MKEENEKVKEALLQAVGEKAEEEEGSWGEQTKTKTKTNVLAAARRENGPGAAAAAAFGMASARPSTHTYINAVS